MCVICAANLFLRYIRPVYVAFLMQAAAVQLLSHFAQNPEYIWNPHHSHLEQADGKIHPESCVGYGLFRLH